MPRILIDEAETWEELMMAFFQEKADTARVKQQLEGCLAGFRDQVEAGRYTAPDGVTKYSDLMKRCRDGIKNCDTIKKQIDVSMANLYEKFVNHQLEEQNGLD